MSEQIQMYRAIDTIDGKDSMFAVRGRQMAVSSFAITGDFWSDPSLFAFSGWSTEPLNRSRMQDPKLIWASQENTEKV